MEIDKLNKWSELLMDTGKRNNLINFRDTKMGTVEVVVPNFFTLFSRSEQSSTFEVYDPKLDDEDDFDFLIESDIDAEVIASMGEITGDYPNITAINNGKDTALANQNALVTYGDMEVPLTTINGANYLQCSNNENEEHSEKNEKNLSKEEFMEIYGARVKKNQILLYNKINKPIPALKNIWKKAKTSIEESGVNIAYIAFGFVHWTESEQSDYEMRAPILLAPIAIENESAISPYYIKVIDSEFIVNPTFAFKLQNEYGIIFPEYDENEGVESYFNTLTSLFAKMKWTISYECNISIFSFLKLNMYKDLKDNADKIIKNKNIRALLGEEDVRVWGGNGIEDKKTENFLDLKNVVDADSSQEEAIEMAKTGKSFVLQGPPGTGKSQTITNIIAECLSDGKKVLFVSEKLAALNVVYDKLKGVGLEEFCLELHSHKANKKQVIEELCHTLKLPKSGVSDKAQKELKLKQEAQQQLDEYAQELHKIRPIIKKSLYKLYEEVSACRIAPDIDFIIQNIKNKGEDFIESAERSLTQYMDYVPNIGYDYHNNFWFGYYNPDCSFQAVKQLEKDFKDVQELCLELDKVSRIVNDKYSINANNLLSSHRYSYFFKLLKDSNYITSKCLIDTEQKFNQIKKLNSLAKEILDKRTILLETFDEDIYKLNGQTLYKKLTKQFNGFFKRLFNNEYIKIINDIKLCKNDAKKPSYKFAVELMDALRIYQLRMQEFTEIEQDIKTILGKEYCGVDTNFVALEEEFEFLQGMKLNGCEFGKIATLPINVYEEEKQSFTELFDFYDKAFVKYSEAEKRLLSCFDENEYNLNTAHLTTLLEKCNGCYNNIDNVDNWCEFYDLLQKLKDLDLRDFIDYIIEDKIESKLLVQTFKKSFYTQWIDVVLHDSPILLKLARVPHDEIVNRFKEKDTLNFEVNKAKIKAKLSSERPNLDFVAQGSSISILLREGEKKRKQKSIRLLFSEIGELVQTLKPCFLMSPLSVSTFLSSDINFDVVIFDEASQIFPQDAIGAVYRGQQLIVVGDSKQMPPSDFFNSSIDVAENEEDDTTDFESILDLCSISFPQRRLKWHYRSRYEQLIAFSNKNFYDNDLITFPSSKADTKGVGVDYYYVDGVFDRKTKTNRLEAEKIVDLVFENIEKYPERSLGVVAFSISQQNLIDKLIYKRRQQDQSKEIFFNSAKTEPFFVKNLETVQGDERDTIIFSIAYAKDSQGRLLLNFGPINREGGERRLNVVVTRAKHNVQIISSLHFSDIDLSRTKSVGTKLLREYLDYAENGEKALERTITVNSFETYDSEFEMEVAEFLKDNGFVVDTQVGCSSFKIDLGLKKPNSSDYVLAIECDGSSYHSSRTARDRDRLRQEILERMGWKFYRIWSTDWFRNKRVEKERLLAVAQEALVSAPKKTKDEWNAEVSFEEPVEIKHFKFPIYVMADDKNTARKCNYNRINIIRAIVKLESPISEEWLLKRIVFLYDRDKVTSVVREEFNYDMRNCLSYGIVRKKGFLYAQDKPIPMLRVPSENAYNIRDIKYVSIEELALGLKEILKQNVTAEKMGLFRLLAKQLGFSRLGDSILVNMEKALELISEEIIVNGEMLSLK